MERCRAPKADSPTEVFDVTLHKCDISCIKYDGSLEPRIGKVSLQPTRGLVLMNWTTPVITCARVGDEWMLLCL